MLKDSFLPCFKVSSSRDKLSEQPVVASFLVRSLLRSGTEEGVKDIFYFINT
jgi:hypothetical protein